MPCPLETNLYNVTPVAMPQIDWPTFDSVCKKELSQGVIKILDTNGIKPDELSALPCVLLEGQLDAIYKSPLEHYPVLAHTSVSFVVVSDDGILLEDVYTRCPKILTSILGNSRSKMVYLMTGNLAEWYSAVVIGSNSDEGLRIVTNTIYTWLCKGGLQRLWEGYTRDNQQDGTFRLMKN